jgi:hypothetical protein
MDRRMVQTPAIEKHVEKPAPERAEQSCPGNAAPEALERRTCRFRPALGITVDQHGGVHRPSGGPRNAVDLQTRLLQQAIESAPGKSTMRAATLQREVDKD